MLSLPGLSVEIQCLAVYLSIVVTHSLLVPVSNYFQIVSINLLVLPL